MISVPLNQPLVLFDMDGTLLDLSFDDWFWLQCMPEAYAQRHHITIMQAGERLDALYKQYRHSLAWYSSAHWQQQTGVDVLALQTQYADKIRAKAFCFELLEQLKQRGIRCWLVSNADRASLALKLSKVPLAAYFEHIISSESLNAAKEQAAFWQNLQAQYPFDPEHSILVDDNATVLSCAKQFGIAQLLMVMQPASNRAAQDLADPAFYPIAQLTDIIGYVDSAGAQHAQSA